jgi:hypothetical protein
MSIGFDMIRANVQSIARHAEEVLDRLFAFREEHPISTCSDLLALLDYGLLHHHYIATLALCPSNNIQHNYAQDHFHKIYSNREYLKLELSDKYSELKSGIDVKDAYRLLNLITYASKIEDMDLSIHILKDFPELIQPFAISLNYSFLDEVKICKHLSILQSVGNMEVASIAILNALMFAPDSVARSKLSLFNKIRATSSRRLKLYKLGYQLMISFAYRNSYLFRKIYEKITKFAPGYKLPFSVIKKVISSDANFYEKINISTDSSDVPYFLDLWSVNLMDIININNNSLPLCDARMVKDISDFQDIIPTHIRHSAKISVAQLFYKENELAEYQQILKPISDSIIDFSVVDNNRIDPFQYELYVENMVNNSIIAKAKKKQFKIDGLHLVILSSVCANLDMIIADAICMLLENKCNCQPLYIGSSDIIESVAKFIASESNSILFGCHQVTDESRMKCLQFVMENIQALHFKNCRKDNILIWHETHAIDFITLIPEIAEHTTIIDISPKKSHYIFNCIMHLPHFLKIRHLTPLIGDYRFFLLEREKLCNHLLNTTQNMIKVYKDAGDFNKLTNLLIECTRQISHKMLGVNSIKLSTVDNQNAFTRKVELLHQKLTVIERDINYKLWLLQNKDDLEDLEC